MSVLLWRRKRVHIGLACLLIPLAVVPSILAQEKPTDTAPRSDYDQRVVAYINENEPVSRHQLGEYLIARGGAEKLELLINRRIIDRACRAANIEVTGGEVESAFAEDLRGVDVDRVRFVREVLKSYR